MNPAKFQFGGVPAVFGADVALTATNGTAIVDTGALASPFRAPYLLDEIRFLVRVNRFTQIAWYYYPLFGNGITAKLQMGRINITQDFVPIWLFGTHVQKLWIAGAGVIDAQHLYGYNEYRWKLPRPLFVPLGSAITVNLQATPFLTAAARVSVSFVARALPVGTKTPPKIDVPFVTAYIPDLQTSTNERTAQSSEKDLVNPFLVPLHVQRFIGRQSYNGGYPAGLVFEVGDDGTIAFVGTDIKLADSMGYNVTRDFTPFDSVFEPGRRAWTFLRQLNPKERYNAAFRITGTYRAKLNPQVSLVGFREEVMA